MIRRTFGSYQIEDLLGTGGMGEVYRARDTRRERLVALKLLPEMFRDDEEYLSRFRREQLVAARLREPHVIPIHDFGEIEGRLFIDMRLVDGEDLGTLIGRTGPLPPARAVHLISQVAEALAAAHADGLVHRDVKPTNVLVTPSDFVYVVDFGIARSIGMTRTSLTITGATVGTLEYMAPERFTNMPIDGRADVYSLACLLHECLTASRPFSGEDLPSLMYAHLYSTPPAASSLSAGVPERLDQVLARGMCKRPEGRYASPLELAAAAQEALQPAGSVVRAPATVRGDAAPPADQRRTEPADQRRAEPGGEHPAAAAAAAPVGAVGIASGDRTHRSVDPLTVRVHPAAAAQERAAGTPQAQPRDVPGPDAQPELLAEAFPEAFLDAYPEVLPAPGDRRGGGSSGPRVPGSSGVPGRGRSPRRRPVLIGAAVAVLVAALAVVLGVLRPFGGAGTRVQVGPASAAPPSATAAPAGPTAGPPATTATVAASIPIPTAGDAIPVGSRPGFIQVAPKGRYAYVAMRDAQVLTVLDTALDKVTATIPIPQGSPQFVVFSPDGRRAYVTATDEKSSNYVDFLDTATNVVVKAIPVSKHPAMPAISPDGRTLYVPSHDEGRIDVVDTAGGTVVDHIAVPANPHWVVFTQDGTVAYASDHESNVVSVIDTRTRKAVATIPVGMAPHSIALSPDGSRLAVGTYEGGTLQVIDTASRAIVAEVPLGLHPQDVTYAPDGRHLYTADVDAGIVDVIDTVSNQPTAHIPTGGEPTSVAVLPDGRQAYVTNLQDGTVRVLHTAAD